MSSDFSPELSTIQSLSGSRPTRSVAAGEVIYSEGDPGDVLFGVVSGTIDVSWGGTQHETFGPGTCFGVAALVDADHRRFGTATCEQNLRKKASELCTQNFAGSVNRILGTAAFRVQTGGVSKLGAKPRNHRLRRKGI